MVFILNEVALRVLKNKAFVTILRPDKKEIKINLQHGD